MVTGQIDTCITECLQTCLAIKNAISEYFPTRFGWVPLRLVF